jgi:hypothetical protein
MCIQRWALPKWCTDAYIIHSIKRQPRLCLPTLKMDDSYKLVLPSRMQWMCPWLWFEPMEDSCLLSMKKKLGFGSASVCLQISWLKSLYCSRNMHCKTKNILLACPPHYVLTSSNGILWGLKPGSRAKLKVKYWTQA